MGLDATGADADSGRAKDVDFLAKAFQGADGIYTMAPPDWGVSDYRLYIGGVGGAYVKAIQASGVKKVVNLSSMGAHLPGGTGAIAGLHDVEGLLDSLEGVDIRHLRAGLFFTNFFFDIPTIQAFGVMGNNYAGDTRVVMVHPRDIAAFASTYLEMPFRGKGHVYVAGEEGKMEDFARVLGGGIGKPELPWVSFSDEDFLAGMMAGGNVQGDSRNVRGNGPRYQ